MKQRDLPPAGALELARVWPGKSQEPELSMSHESQWLNNLGLLLLPLEYNGRKLT